MHSSAALRAVPIRWILIPCHPCQKQESTLLLPVESRRVLRNTRSDRRSQYGGRTSMKLFRVLAVNTSTPGLCICQEPRPSTVKPKPFFQAGTGSGFIRVPFLTLFQHALSHPQSQTAQAPIPLTNKSREEALISVRSVPHYTKPSINIVYCTRKPYYSDLF